MTLVAARRLACGLALLLALFPQPSWALRTGATPDDMIMLGTDFVAFQHHLALIRMAGMRPLAVQRQLELMGLAGSIDSNTIPDQQLRDAVNSGSTYEVIQALLDKHLDAYLNIIDQEGKRIIFNRASSCPMAVDGVLLPIVGLRQQLQRLGLSELDDRVSAMMFDFMRISITACLDEAFDFCVQSGSVQPIIDIVVSLSRQLSLAGLDLDVLQRGIRRMQACGVYELRSETSATTTHGYPIYVRYTSQTETTMRAILRLQFTEEITQPQGLIQAHFTSHGEAWNHFEYQMPKVKCSGAGHTCMLRGHPDPERGSFAYVELPDLRVAFSTLRAYPNPKFQPTLRPYYPVVFEQYRPAGMDENLLVLTFATAPIRVDVSNQWGPVSEADVSLEFNDEPITGWRHHDVEWDGTLFTKTVSFVGDFGRGPFLRQVREQAKLTLIHKPNPPVVDEDVPPPAVPAEEKRAPLRRRP